MRKERKQKKEYKEATHTNNSTPLLEPTDIITPVPLILTRRSIAFELALKKKNKKNNFFF
jgi:hypothetical protein